VPRKRFCSPSCKNSAWLQAHKRQPGRPPPEHTEKLVGEKLIEAKKMGEVAEHGGDRRSKSTPSTLNDLGITRDQSADWQRRARTPPDPDAPIGELRPTERPFRSPDLQEREQTFRHLLRPPPLPCESIEEI
jgi:hypothetical protein